MKNVEIKLNSSFFWFSKKSRCYNHQILAEIRKNFHLSILDSCEKHFLAFEMIYLIVAFFQEEKERLIPKGGE